MPLELANIDANLPIHTTAWARGRGARPSEGGSPTDLLTLAAGGH